VKPEDVFRNTYLLEFLRLEEKSSCSESDLVLFSDYTMKKVSSPTYRIFYSKWEEGFVLKPGKRE